MITNIIHTTEFYYKEGLIKAAYFFANASSLSRSGKEHKILLEISFAHPENGDKMDLRVVKSILILCQPKEVIAVVVHREIKEFLQMFRSIETGNIKTSLGLSMEKNI